MATPTFRISLVIVCLLTVGASFCHADDNGDLPLSGTVTAQLYATGFEFAEGPTFDRLGNLYVANYRGLGNIGRITKEGSASVLCSLDKLAPVDDRKPQANGIKIDSHGRLIVADWGGGRLLRIAADGKSVEVLAERWKGKRFGGINAVALDTAGNIYFTDPRGSSLESPTGSVYRYDINTKSLAQVATGLAYPNGIAVSPHRKHLCVSESRKFRIQIYDFEIDEKTKEPTLAIARARTLITFPFEDKGDIKGGKFEPDGMIFDAKSRLYVAMWTAGYINVVELDSGKLIRQYDAGGEQVTNCHFHGPYLYTTIAAKEAVFRLELDVQGHHYNAQ
jgi:gluconolactonase